MWFWWFILICDCLIPAIMIIAGRMMWKHCPKKINGVVGYRTKMSMINMDTWRFAHDHAGKLWWKVGIGLLGPTMLIFRRNHRGRWRNHRSHSYQEVVDFG